MIETLRTPDRRFENLPGFKFAPRYVEDLDGFQGLRMHYLDEGRPDAVHTILCLHGEPTWSYLYRKMIPVFTAAGHRVIVPDFFGFGRSDKPVDDQVYTFDFHRDSLIRLIEHLALNKITLVVQDWGGLLGLTLPVALPDRIARLIVMNTALGTGDVALGQGFLDWRAYVKANPDLDVARLMGRACPQLSPAECDAYAAPFPDKRSKAGVRRFPEMVPDHPDMDGAALSRQARDFWQNAWLGPTFMAIGMQDHVLGPPAMRALRKQIRDCPEPMEIAEAGHFVQEWGAEVAAGALAAFG